MAQDLTSPLLPLLPLHSYINTTDREKLWSQKRVSFLVRYSWSPQPLLLSVTVPPGTTEETQATTNQMQGASTPSSTPLTPTKSPEGTQVTAATGEFTHSSVISTPVASQSPSTPSPTWSFGSYKVIIAKMG